MGWAHVAAVCVCSPISRMGLGMARCMGALLCTQSPVGTNPGRTGFCSWQKYTFSNSSCGVGRG
jgi:hypothetical protein